MIPEDKIVGYLWLTELQIAGIPNSKTTTSKKLKKQLETRLQLLRWVLNYNMVTCYILEDRIEKSPMRTEEEINKKLHSLLLDCRSYQKYTKEYEYLNILKWVLYEK